MAKHSGQKDLLYKYHWLKSIVKSTAVCTPVSAAIQGGVKYWVANVILGSFNLTLALGFATVLAHGTVIFWWHAGQR